MPSREQRIAELERRLQGSVKTSAQLEIEAARVFYRSVPLERLRAEVRLAETQGTFSPEFTAELDAHLRQTVGTGLVLP